MSTYAVSDIHGCFDELMAALDLAGFGEDDHLFVLGDLIDRGPQIGSCVSWLVERNANDENSNVTFLMGNHEELASWAFADTWSSFRFNPLYLSSWERNGGNETICQMKELDPSIVDAFQTIVENAPRAVKLRSPEGPILLCHAGIRPAEPESEEAEWLIQSMEDLLWIGTEWYCAPEQAPFHVVSGHTPVFLLSSQPEIPNCPESVRAEGSSGRMMHWGHKHDIDCGCVYGLNMGVLRLNDWEAFYVAKK